ncbi:nuclear pore complex protein DDB_G0274915 [Anabrus simplex]|uniref:nuclear pore complex protein DDB_G0274915 n=1 Tax=Anabrus simplex TaxID=316456 RepID=UPI0035A28852
MPSRATVAALLVVLIALACAASDESSSTSDNAVSSTGSTDGTTSNPIGESSTVRTGDPPPSSTTGSPEGTSTTARSTADGDSAVVRSSTNEDSTSVVQPAAIRSPGSGEFAVPQPSPLVGDSAEASSINRPTIVRSPTDGDTAVASSIASSAVVRSPQGRSINSYGGWKNDPTMQYHIQTDEGPERYFKYQTISGQYRKEKRLEDGTVVGTYGWVDPNGYLRLRDYVADNTGYKVVKTKMVYVGKDESIGNAVSKAKNVPSQGGTGYVPSTYSPTTYAPPTSIYTSTTPSVTPYPYSVPSNPLLYPSLSNPPSNSLSGAYSQQQQYTANPYFNNPYFKPQQQQQQYNSNPYYTPASDRYDNYNNYRQPQPPFPLYDGISATHNGFRYYLPRQYHEEERQSGDQTAGSFGYIDPFGIRRVIYYNTSPGSGFVHKKNNRYVGFDATPYDPRF